MIWYLDFKKKFLLCRFQAVWKNREKVPITLESIVFLTGKDSPVTIDLCVWEPSHHSEFCTRKSLVEISQPEWIDLPWQYHLFVWIHYLFLLLFHLLIKLRFSTWRFIGSEITWLVLLLLDFQDNDQSESTPLAMMSNNMFL
jgi:hypothetical protein